MTYASRDQGILAHIETYNKGSLRAQIRNIIIMRDPLNLIFVPWSLAFKVSNACKNWHEGVLIVRFRNYLRFWLKLAKKENVV